MYIETLNKLCHWMNEWVHLIPINEKTDGGKKKRETKRKAQDTNSADTYKMKIQQSATDTNYCIAHRWAIRRWDRWAYIIYIYIYYIILYYILYYIELYNQIILNYIGQFATESLFQVW